MIDTKHNTQAPIDIIRLTGGKRTLRVPLNEDGILLSRRNASTPYYGVRTVKQTASGLAIQFSSSAESSDWFEITAPEGISLEVLGEISTAITLSEMRSEMSLHDLMYTPMIIETSHGEYAIKDGTLRPFTDDYFNLKMVNLSDWIILVHDEEVRDAQEINRSRAIRTTPEYLAEV